MKASDETPATPAMLDALRRRAGPGSILGFADFMDVALYDPEVGYYRKDGPRIGFGKGTDFVTATTSSPLFGKLVSAACAELLGSSDLGRYTFVEIGAERGRGILDGIAHPFRAVRLTGVGQALKLEGPTIVFSNELFDAQPVRRFRKGSGGWRELGVAVGERSLSEVELRGAVPAELQLPGDVPDGYVIDAPVAAAELAAAIASLPWEGLFLAFDYGKSWEELAYGTPAGTARAYRLHVQNNDLLADAGDQDLTCHVCWDWIGEKLEARGFGKARVESQEAFFVKHAGAFIEALAAAGAGLVSREKQSLMQLLHPAHMGQKFQALWALRGPR
jgi:SAM-dependent MidA family methyltransferase